MAADSKVVVVTGASGGLGLSIAQTFASHGWKVIGTGRSEQPGSFPADGEFARFDAGEAVACEAFWKATVQSHPEASFCLVNNAGGYIGGSLLETTPESFEQQMRSIYFTSVYMTRGMASAVSAAKVINIISASALTAHKNDSAYEAAKGAQMHFFQSLQKEFSPEQYRITNIYPDNIASHRPNPDAMSPEDLSAFVLEQAENEASYYLRDVTLNARKR